MKALPKRKGNESLGGIELPILTDASMKALPKRKGNDLFPPEVWALGGASMKALPKRKGNASSAPPSRWPPVSLNESPSQKEGKCPPRTGWVASPPASMKALPKRKG
ncbi:hypothetical protein, partial [Rothia sp. HMSC061E04]|uniref:hypothetical protein n=1 Tax=Rothia sp. HMSC061E04 TaxID=1739431 RepID=UPI001AEF9678